VVEALGFCEEGPKEKSMSVGARAREAVAVGRRREELDYFKMAHGPQPDRFFFSFSFFETDWAVISWNGFRNKVVFLFCQNGLKFPIRKKYSFK